MLNVNLLSTKVLPDDLVQAFIKKKINLRQKDFIDVQLDYNARSFKARLNNPSSQARVFTSKNALFSLQKLADEEGIEFHRKKNFVVGIRATELLQDFGQRVDVKSGNAISLAQIIARNKDIKEVDYFCGDKALEDIPEYLSSKGIKVNKEVVYRTSMVAHEVEYLMLHAVMFFSPSSVFSYFKRNRLKLETMVFTIGATTADAVKLKCNNSIILADEPSIPSTVKKVIEHYRS